MFDPIIASEKIKDEFISYISTLYNFSDKNIQKQFIDRLEEIISKGPYLEINDVFKSSETINDLINKNILSKLFLDLEKEKRNKKYKENFPLDRELYNHQIDAIKKITNGENVIVSTGTGSGKTNCFLIPVIDYLLKEKENGTLDDGIRAIFIYPMNALANDQLKNIRKLLMHYEDITFGIYTGTTKKYSKEATIAYKSIYGNEIIPELQKPLINERISRDEMKKNPPHILFTNYVMLEHLLLRPEDDVLFQRGNFKFVVLDEAHIYTGATGIEISILIRRLRARISSKSNVQFILTSATLGNNDKDILKFGKNICDEDFKIENIIRSEREKFIKSSKIIDYDVKLIKDLCKGDKDINEIIEHYNLYIKSSSKEEIIYDILKNSRIYQDFRSKICPYETQIKSFKEIKDNLNIDKEDIVSFINLCNRARKNGKALFDARYHYFIRCLEGCYISIANNENKLFLNRKKQYKNSNNQVHNVFEIAVCNDCGKISLVGDIKHDYFDHSKQLNGIYLVKKEELSFELEIKDEIEEYILCESCGKITKSYSELVCKCHSKYKKSYYLTKKDNCLSCGTGNYKRIYLGNDAATAVIATSLYENLLESDFKNKEEKKQFLIFSDSRQDAAKFSCYLEETYKEFLRRRGIYHLIKNYNSDKLNNTKYDINEFIKNLETLFLKNKTFSSYIVDESDTVNSISKRNSCIAILNELVGFNRKTSLVSLGILRFDFIGNTNDIINELSKKYNKNYDDIENLLNLLIFEIVKQGAISIDDNSILTDSDREYIYHSKHQKYITKNGTDLNNCVSWMPRQNEKGKYYQKSNLKYVKEILGINEEEAIEFLNLYFEYLVVQNFLESIDECEKYTLNIKNFIIKPCTLPITKFYKCNKCLKVSQFNLNGKCIVNNCNGEVSIVTFENLNKNNHYLNLYASSNLESLTVKEHTAQLSKDIGLKYQEKFIKKEINALSCSTTFEMGVDVGDLETVFLRDIPPLPSNYAQRAGRAGRSLDAVAYVITYAKLSAHDLYFYNHLEKMISGSISPPLFKIDNEKLIKRHINSISLYLFFKNNIDIYNNNNADIFLNKDGYKKYREWIETKPDELKELLKNSIPKINYLHNRLELDTFGWINWVFGSNGSLKISLDKYNNYIKQYEKEINSIVDSEKEKNRLKFLKRKLEIHKKNKLIDFLARENIIPKYGFPVDIIELLPNGYKINDEIKLNLDLQKAISEYAPSSEVVANGKIYKSRYIKKSKFVNGNFEYETTYFIECENCKNINIFDIKSNDKICNYCQNELKENGFEESIEPRAGFISEEEKIYKNKIKEKIPKSEVRYLRYNKDEIKIGDIEFNLNRDKVKIETNSNADLFIKSNTQFYVCNDCGYSYSLEELGSINSKEIKKDSLRGALTLNLSKTKKSHKNFNGYTCNCFEFKKYYIHHIFSTDIAIITFDIPEISKDKNIMQSVMYSILYSVANYLNIDREDINATLSYDEYGVKSIIIYDSVPGGAGHSSRLIEENIFKEVLKNAKNSMESCNCDTSCYNCLRSYDNQLIHDILDRKLVIEFLDKLLM